MINFSTHFNATLDVVLTVYSGKTQVLPNFNTSDHAVLVTLPSFINVITPADCQVYHDKGCIITLVLLVEIYKFSARGCYNFLC